MNASIHILITGILIGLLGGCRHHYQPIPEDFGCQQGKMTASKSFLGTEREQQTIENPFGTLAILRDTTQWRGAFISHFESFILQYVKDTSNMGIYDADWGTWSTSQKQAYLANQKKGRYHCCGLSSPVR